MVGSDDVKQGHEGVAGDQHLTDQHSAVEPQPAPAPDQALAAEAKPRAPKLNAPTLKFRPGLVSLGLALGLGVGLLAYLITVTWIDRIPSPSAAQSLIVFFALTAAGLLLTAERGAPFRGAGLAPALGLLVAAPTLFMLEGFRDARNLSPFPPFFWFFVGAPVTSLLGVSFARAALAPKEERYTEFFGAGLTTPLILIGAALMAALSVVLVYAWASLMRAMNVDAIYGLTQQPWFMLPFIGATAGLAIGMMRHLEPVLQALRFTLLLVSRWVMPLTAALSFAFLVVVLAKGPQALFAGAEAGPFLLGLALIGMLIFNGVYQNGAAPPPALWLRLSTIVALLTFPAYSALAAAAFWSRIAEFGATPARITALVAAALTALYSVVGLAGVGAEVLRRDARWMAPVKTLNVGMAGAWIVALVALASPVANPWSISARAEEQRLMAGAADPAHFDFGYLRFSLGDAGAAALDRLSRITGVKNAEAIRAGAVKALSASSYWSYRHGETQAPRPAPTNDAVAPAADDTLGGVDSLKLNPKQSGDSLDPATASP